MNDTPGAQPTASQEEMEAVVLEGRRILERIEKGFDKLNEVYGKGYSFGMISKEELGSMVRESKKLLKATYAHHKKGTEIAKRNNADGPLSRGGPGR
jgi:hypothetical protein